ncbi:finger BED domain-containing 5-like [Octopus vulgaris]|uniref:Finger BED domain-containing 5-like n=1 Tax=Octopus vulgaris TaxID=6645 RepID=A0AA36FLD0_OCTVU|nr:finger BED domain-containing 5-like [Octopus vulgaris]
MKAHTLGESLILSAYKKIVKTMLGNYAAKEVNRNLVSNDAVLRRILETSSNIEKTKNSEPYHRSVSGKSFSRNCGLTKHKCTHTAERNQHLYDICGKSF